MISLSRRSLPFLTPDAYIAAPVDPYLLLDWETTAALRHIVVIAETPAGMNLTSSAATRSPPLSLTTLATSLPLDDYECGHCAASSWASVQVFRHPNTTLNLTKLRGWLFRYLTRGLAISRRDKVRRRMNSPARQVQPPDS